MYNICENSNVQLLQNITKNQTTVTALRLGNLWMGELAVTQALRTANQTKQELYAVKASW